MLFDPEATPAQIDEHFMALALREAEIAESHEEIPIGAVVVFDNKVIGRGNNSNKTLQDPTAHAEMIAITAACNYLQSRYLEQAALYVTIEPCAMCAGAMVLARLGRLVFGARDPKTGACGSMFNIVQDPRLNHQLNVTSGVREFECSSLISQFFESIRGKQK